MDYSAITLTKYNILHEWSVYGNPIYTGVDITADSVYSYSSGIVLAIGKDSTNTYCITVQYDVFNVFRYGHLKSVSIGAGAVIQEGTLLGKADRFVRFEYATKEQNSSKWPVRVGTETYWKQNPSSIQITPPAPTEITGPDTNKELLDGKGE